MSKIIAICVALGILAAQIYTSDGGQLYLDRYNQAIEFFAEEPSDKLARSLIVYGNEADINVVRTKLGTFDSLKEGYADSYQSLRLKSEEALIREGFDTYHKPWNLSELLRLYKDTDEDKELRTLLLSYEGSEMDLLRTKALIHYWEGRMGMAYQVLLPLAIQNPEYGQDMVHLLRNQGCTDETLVWQIMGVFQKNTLMTLGFDDNLTRLPPNPQTLSSLEISEARSRLKLGKPPKLSENCVIGHQAINVN